MLSNSLPLLRLLQLADSALPVGGISHSFGLESMLERGYIDVEHLAAYLESLLAESLLVDAVYCRESHAALSAGELSQLSGRLSAFRLARESREASLAMGKRFLRLVASLEPSPALQTAAALGDLHFPAAFGYASGVLNIPSDAAVAAFLHQAIGASLSAAQRLSPLGQMQSSQIAWRLKPAIQETVARSSNLNVNSVAAFSHLPELASMSHPLLETRLFIS